MTIRFAAAILSPILSPLSAAAATAIHTVCPVHRAQITRLINLRMADCTSARRLMLTQRLQVHKIRDRMAQAGI